MDELVERRARLPGDPESPVVARRMVSAALREAGLGGLLDDAVLLTSELCENAVLHAGTGFDVELTIAGAEVTIAVTDHGTTALEIHRATPRPTDDRLATHARGLLLVDALSAAWGTRHDARGHQVWFTIGGGDGSDRPPPPAAGSPAPTAWPDVATCRWLLHLPSTTASARRDAPSITASARGDAPAGRAPMLPLPVLADELVRRLCEVIGADGAEVLVDYGDGNGTTLLANHGRMRDDAALTVALPVHAPLTGRLLVRPRPPAATAVEIAELSAQRVALAIESDWVRRADRQRKSWMSYLAEASELLAHSLDVELTAAIVPQIIVPRLGQWCAVHLLDDAGQLRLAALTHADETALPQLRAVLDTGAAGLPPAQLRSLLGGGTDAERITAPSDGVAVALMVRRLPLGTLSVGRPADRSHSPEEIMVISDLARRAAPAIDNALRNAAQVATSQALQQALLPRAMPKSDGVEFAATYVPASAGADVGGDFYDVMEIADGQWLVSIGDVCGKGARAAARTGLVRDVLRVLVRDGRPSARAFEQLNEMMLESHDPEQFATVALALISRQPVDGRPGLAVELVLAGHDQPVLVCADGTARMVGRHGTAAGLIGDFAVYPTRHLLGPGDALVSYTDGITERRRGDEQFGQARLVRTLAAAAGGTAESLVAAVWRAVDGFSSEPQRDDIVVMVVRAPDH